MLLEPVCGMDVKGWDEVITSEHEGQTYYFCSLSCKQQFDQQPGLYAKQSQAATDTV